MTYDEADALITKHVKPLREHFDCITLGVCWESEGDTHFHFFFSGNKFAQKSVAEAVFKYLEKDLKDWICQGSLSADDEEEEENEDDDGDAWKKEKIN